MPDAMPSTCPILPQGQRALRRPARQERARHARRPRAAPETMAPSTTCAPPMPVPAVTMSTCRWPRPAPASASPSACACTSLTTATGRPVATSIALPTLAPGQPAMMPVALGDDPALGVDHPGRSRTDSDDLDPFGPGPVGGSAESVRERSEHPRRPLGGGGRDPVGPSHPALDARARCGYWCRRGRRRGCRWRSSTAPPR